jgi:hypothetical protein
MGSPTFGLTHVRTYRTFVIAITIMVAYPILIIGCIDKSSSAEPSEAINSMYRWYQCAEICYVNCRGSFEADETTTDKIEIPDLPSKPSTDSSPEFGVGNLRPWQKAILRCIQNCRWFTRGWTLQELIALRRLHFFDMSW